MTLTSWAFPVPVAAPPVRVRKPRGARSTPKPRQQLRGVGAAQLAARRPAIEPVELAAFPCWLDALLYLLERHGELSGRQLAEATGLSIKQVNNCLRYPRQEGRVRCSRPTGAGPGIYSLTAAYVPSDLAFAVALLRQRGWTVEPPKAQ